MSRSSWRQRLTSVRTAIDRLGDFPTANRRIFPVGAMAAGIGVAGAFIAGCVPPFRDPADERKPVEVSSREDTFRARVIWFREENMRDMHLSVASWLAGPERP